MFWTLSQARFRLWIFYLLPAAICPTNLHQTDEMTPKEKNQKDES